jgi:cytidine deaminase
MPRKVDVTCTLEAWAFEELPLEDQDLLRAAHEAVERAYAPYSGFRVGAAALLENGEVVTGNNQENAAYPSGMCAERVALFHSASRFPGVAVKALAVASDGEAEWGAFSPCGGCRQVIRESEFRQAEPIRLILQARQDEVAIAAGIAQYLPFSFRAKGLGRDAR